MRAFTLLCYLKFSLLLTVVLCLEYLAAGKVVALNVTGDPSEVLDTVSGSSEKILGK